MNREAFVQHRVSGILLPAVHNDWICVPSCISFRVRLSSRVFMEPSSFARYVSVTHDHFFVLFGGYDGTTWMNDMHEFDFHKSIWRPVQASGETPSIRSCPSWTKVVDVVCLFGFSMSAALIYIYMFTPYCDLGSFCDTVEIEMTKPLHTLLQCDNSVFVFGGYDGVQRMNDFYECRLDTYTWTNLPCLGDVPTPRSPFQLF